MIEGELKLGQTVYVIKIHWVEERTYGGHYPADWSVDECRILVVDADTVALVREDGKVIFRQRNGLFDSNEEAIEFAELHDKDGAGSCYSLAEALA